VRESAAAPTHLAPTAALLLGLGAVLFVVQLTTPPLWLNHDVALYLTAGQRLLEGDRPFVEVIDINPPMIVYVSAVPTAVAAATGLPIGPVALVFFAALFGLAFWLLVAALRAARAEGTAAVLIGAAWLHLLTMSYHDPAYGFGQRDALVGAFLLPLVVLRFARHAGGALPKGLAVSAGLAGLMAIGMKPQYGVVLLAAEGVAALQHRRLPRFGDAEVVAFVGAGLAYALHFFVVPGMSAFYTRWVPFIASGYDAYDWPPLVTEGLRAPSMLSLGLPPAVLGLAGAGLGVASLRAKDRTLRLAGVLGVAAAVSLLLFVAQGKGWSYHLLPFHLSTLTALPLAAAYAMRALRRRAGGAVAPAIVSQGTLAMVVVLLVAFAEQPLLLTRTLLALPLRYHAQADALETQTPPGTRVLALSTDVGAMYPALTLSGRRSAGRFPFVYPLAFFYHDASGYDDLGRWIDDEAWFYDALLEDVRQHTPALILVDTTAGPQGTPPFFSVRGYLQRRGFYHALAADYVRAPPLGPFEVLRRRSALAAP